KPRRRRSPRRRARGDRAGGRAFLKMNRPAWPKGYGGAEGTEIRHVVRNAVNRDALLAEFRHHQPRLAAQPLLQDFEQSFAGVIGKLGIGGQTTAWELVAQLYRADNFSFDFILEESGIPPEEIARRQEVLAGVNKDLNAHQV